jgi:hypothetical protein
MNGNESPEQTTSVAAGSAGWWKRFLSALTISTYVAPFVTVVLHFGLPHLGWDPGLITSCIVIGVSVLWNALIGTRAYMRRNSRRAYPFPRWLWEIAFNAPEIDVRRDYLPPDRSLLIHVCGRIRRSWETVF